VTWDGAGLIENSKEKAVRVVSLLSAVLLMLMVSTSSWVAVPTRAQVQVQTEPTRSSSELKRMSEETNRRKGEEERWVAEFLKLPPEERVRLWLKTTDSDFDVHDALIIQGQDTVQLLANLVYKRTDARKRALKLLCEIDRFVANEDMLLPEAGNEIYVKPLRKRGRLNRFMMVDGRRIGKVGFDAVLWAAEQTEDDDLRFHARYSSGLLAQDLRKLSLDEQLREWRKAVIDSKGSLGLFGNFKAHTLMIELDKLLVEQAPESIPPLIEMLERDQSPYVREEAIDVLASVDSYRMRLRATELGRRAIEAIRLALERGELKPFLTKRESREEEWKHLSAELFDDAIAFHNFSNWAAVALAFEKFYGERTVHRYYTVQEIIAPKQEMQQFVTYLTKVDPYFPSWEYTYYKFLSQDEVLHPRFKAKMARYHEYWKRFKASEPPKPTSP
jgi:hypothetical protein